MTEAFSLDRAFAVCFGLDGTCYPDCEEDCDCSRMEEQHLDEFIDTLSCESNPSVEIPFGTAGIADLPETIADILDGECECGQCLKQRGYQLLTYNEFLRTHAQG